MFPITPPASPQKASDPLRPSEEKEPRPGPGGPRNGS